MKKTIITVVGRDTVGIIAKICTYLAENQVRAAWESTDRVLTEAGKYQSVFSEKIAYEIPLETTS